MDTGPDPVPSVSWESFERGDYPDVDDIADADPDAWDPDRWDAAYDAAVADWIDAQRPDDLPNDPDRWDDDQRTRAVAAYVTAVAAARDHVLPRLPARPWRPDDDAAADWCGEQYLAAARRLAVADDEIAEVRARVERWAEARRGRDARTVDRMRGYLVGYALRLYRDDPTFRTRVLPSVRVGVTVTQRVDVVDVAALTAWADATPDRADVVRRPDPVPDKNALRAVLLREPGGGSRTPRLVPVDADTRERIPGIEIVANVSPRVTET